MQKVVALMAEFKVGEFDEGHKVLHPKPTKLLVSDDVQEELKRASYWNFEELFEGFDVDICHQMARS